jgi:sec-independent protein translocase protein TatB
MFDIGFWELVLIAVMALLILGPERLPVAIRTVRQWLASVRQFSHSIKTELNEELRVHELHANLKKAEQSNLQNLSPEVADSLKTLQQAAESVNEPFKQQAEIARDAESFADKPTMSESVDENSCHDIANKNQNKLSK